MAERNRNAIILLCVIAVITIALITGMIFWLKSAYSDTTEETISGNYATNPTSTTETTTEPTDATTQTTTISEVEASYITQIEE